KNQTMVVFRHFPGTARDQRPYVRLFVMPKDATVFVITDNEGLVRPQGPELSGLRELPISRLKIAFPSDPGGTANPEVITSAKQLSESAELKGAAEEIKKQVDFDKEKLVFIAWYGSHSDQFEIGWRLSDKKTIVSFRTQPGRSLDYSERMRLFVIP